MDLRPPKTTMKTRRWGVARVVALGVAAVLVSGFGAACASTRSRAAAGSPERVEVASQTRYGRVLLADSATHIEKAHPDAVVVAGSFAGAATAAYPLRAGVRGLILHEAGVGRNRAGISGLGLAERFGVPMAAVQTMSARIADGASVYRGRVAHANRPAAALGVRPGMSTREAADLMLGAAPGRPLDVGEVADPREHVVHRGDDGNVVAVWSISLVEGERRGDVFCVASHAGVTMAEFARSVRPRGIIANDAWMARDQSGIAGLQALGRQGVPAAAVGALTAEIGDGRSTHRDGIISATNEAAERLGVRVGQPAAEAARLMLGAPRG